MLDLTRLSAFDDVDAIQSAYTNAIRKAMDGRHDNLLKRMRYYVMQQLAEQSIRCNPALDIAEFGCWYGHSTLMVQEVLLRHGSGRMHIFDSFEGLSKFGPNDSSDLIPENKQEAEREHYRSSRMHLESIVNAQRTVIHAGWIPDSLASARVGTISFAMIDVDLYDPTAHSLAFAYERLCSGGAIFFDDYGYKNFPGAKVAVDEFVGSRAPALFVKNPFGSAYLIK